MAEHKPHLALLDLVLPETDGIELMNEVHRIADVPVIFLSEYGQGDTVARAFDMGAADYLVKPFSHSELAARIRAALRRGQEPSPGEPTVSFAVGELNIDYARRRVTLAGEPVELTAMEYAVLYQLAAQAPRVDDPRVAAPAGVGTGEGGRGLAAAERGEQAAAQAGGRCRQPQVHRHRATGGVLDGGGGSG